MAAQIIERANNAKVTIFQNPLLARALYFSGEIGKEIPERLYQAVAVVLAYIYRVDKGEDLERPEVELPEDLRFNEYGDVMSGEKMRKHRSLGEMISTATFWDAECSYLSTAWNCSKWVKSCARTSGSLRLCFVSWVGCGSLSQI